MNLKDIILASHFTSGAGGGGGDLSNYYTKAQSDGRYALKDDLREIGRACYNLLDKAVYIGDETDISALKDALWALVGNTLVSISAAFTQGETVVYPSTSLDTLKPMLVVTATYDDGETAVVNDYTLSGTLTEGASTITATYNGKTATFTVNVSAEPIVPTLDYISAVYTQSGTVYPSTALADLKADLVVTAHLTDASPQILDAADYALSGTLVVGTSPITVSYEGKTTTFNVTVTAEETPEITGYTSIGNPDIVSGIYTPTSGNWVKTPQPISVGNNSWEIQTRVIQNVAGGGFQDILCTVDTSNSTKHGILLEENGQYNVDENRRGWALNLSSEGTTWDIAFSVGELDFNANDIIEGEWYYSKIGYDGINYFIAQSTDGVNWNTKTYESQNHIYDGLSIGFGVVRNVLFNGKIDLNATKMYVNGNLWWKAIEG